MAAILSQPQSSQCVNYESVLVQAMACHKFRTKPLPKPMLTTMTPSGVSRPQ